MNMFLMAQDHDHSGDHLGSDEPVESINVESVTIRDFESPSSIIVYEDGDQWRAFRTADQEIIFEDKDGVEVVNSALDELASQGGTPGKDGVVRVTADVGGTVLESNKTIDHTRDGTTLSIEPGVTFRYTGPKEAVVLAGEGVTLEFDTIEAPNADYGIVDFGLRDADVEGNTLAGAGESLWLSDADNRLAEMQGPSGTSVDILRMDCVQGAKRGVTLTSAPDTSIDGYTWNVTIVGPTETGVSIGDESAADTVNNQVFYASVKGGENDATSLVEINDSYNSVFLETSTPATGGDWDVVISDSVEDSFLLPLTQRDTLRVKREALVTADFSRYDVFRHEVMELDLDPDSLNGYRELQSGSSYTELDRDGVVHVANGDSGNWANVSKQMDYNFGQLSFQNSATLQTRVEMGTNQGQRGWLVWGDREGPAVGWYVEDDVLYGFVHDSESATTVTLVDGFEEGDAWRLSAFYNPPTDVHYYVDDELAGVVSQGLPTGDTHAHRVFNADFTNTTSGEKRLRWREWRNHQYPSGGSIA